MFIELTIKSTDKPILVNTLNIDTIMPLENGEGCEIWEIYYADTDVDYSYYVKETYDEIKEKLLDAGKLRRHLEYTLISEDRFKTLCSQPGAITVDEAESEGKE